MKMDVNVGFNFTWSLRTPVVYELATRVPTTAFMTKSLVWAVNTPLSKEGCYPPDLAINYYMLCGLVERRINIQAYTHRLFVDMNDRQGHYI